MAPRAKKVIRLKVETIESGPHQYRPLSSTLSPEEVYIDISVPKDECIIEIDKALGETKGIEMKILTPDGFKILLKEVEHKIYEAHEEFTTEIRKSKVVPKKKKGK